MPQTALMTEPKAASSSVTVYEGIHFSGNFTPFAVVLAMLVTIGMTE